MAETDNLDKLTRAETGDHAKPDTKYNFEYRRRKVISICKSLTIHSEDYDPSKTVDSISGYMSTDSERIIYSEITDHVYSMSSEEQGIFNSNLEKLLNYVLSKDNAVSKTIQNSVIRLWDHVHLAMRQVDNAKQILETSTSEAKQSLYDELYREFKGMEKEYITILGIFATIVISFVSGITFSTSVLQNMHSVGIYRLTFVLLAIAFVLLNTINMLIQYIFRLNNEGNYKFPIRGLNITIALLLALLIIAWLLNLKELPSFIRDFLPWISSKS